MKWQEEGAGETIISRQQNKLVKRNKKKNKAAGGGRKFELEMRKN
jgi:hypothetical protein